MLKIKKEDDFMKVAIPVDEKSLNSNVCVSFGRAPYFLIYDTALETADFTDNSAVNEQGGAGIKAAQLMADKGVEAVISVRLGENAAQVLSAAGIKLYKSVFGSAQKNINDFSEGKLEPLTEIHAGFHHHGG